MGAESKIEWTNHTFNPWEGCMKVSEGCKHCYAEGRDKIWHLGAHWGPGSTRKPMSEQYWNQPAKWNEAAKTAGVRARVFCASLADVMEDHPEVEQHRLRLFKVIEDTPWLNWQLLTKRPENFERFLPKRWLMDMPDNVWLGTSIEGPLVLSRINDLLRVPASVHFLSMEPMIGEVDLKRIPHPEHDPALGYTWNCLTGVGIDGERVGDIYKLLPTITWVIVGGESGPQARPMSINWATDIRNDCRDYGVAFLFKQWGEWHPEGQLMTGDVVNANMLTCASAVMPDGSIMRRVGKKLAGRLLHAKEYNDYPTRFDF